MFFFFFFNFVSQIFIKHQMILESEILLSILFTIDFVAVIVSIIVNISWTSNNHFWWWTIAPSLDSTVTKHNDLDHHRFDDATIQKKKKR